MSKTKINKQKHIKKIDTPIECLKTKGNNLNCNRKFIASREEIFDRNV